VPPRPPAGADAGAGDQPQLNIEEMAPIKPRPQVYPIGTTYYSVPITFELEIIDPSKAKPAPPADSSAAADADRTGGLS
jgi:hypothetical protein